ncbi:DnaJ domain-containing protein [Deltaproteobacteria bacterium TL4]
MQDYYQLLNIAPQATVQEIRKAFRTEAKKYHPDLYQGTDSSEKQQRQKRFILLTQAYETLIDDKLRRAYDVKHQFQHQQSHAQQKTKASTSYSSQTKTQSKNTKAQESSSFSQKEPEVSLEELLSDVEQLLQRFGLSFKDPLEMLVDWARRIFKNFMEAWNEEPDGKGSASPFQTDEAHYHSPLDDIEEELNRLKKQYSHKNSSTQSETRAQTKKQPLNSDIEKELNALKKKYGKR